MSKKIIVEGYSVSIFVPVRDASDYWHQKAISPEEARAAALEMREAIKRHLSYDFRDLMDRVIDVEPQAHETCEHCGYVWTEKSAVYNGGCCDEDEKNAPSLSLAERRP